MPQADTIFVPSTLRACSTSAPGIGAPAHRNVFRLGTGVSASCTVFVRSARKGVEAIVKLAPCWRISSTAFLGSQTSSSTALARNAIGIISPYMKPVWCAIGEAIRITSSWFSRSRSA